MYNVACFSQTSNLHDNDPLTRNILLLTATMYVGLMLGVAIVCGLIFQSLMTIKERKKKEKRRESGKKLKSLVEQSNVRINGLNSHLQRWKLKLLDNITCRRQYDFSSTSFVLRLPSLFLFYVLLSSSTSIVLLSSSFFFIFILRSYSSFFVLLRSSTFSFFYLLRSFSTIVVLILHSHSTFFVFLSMFFYVLLPS